MDGWHLPGLRQVPPSNRLRFFDFNGERFRREVVVLKKTQDHLTSLQIQIVKDSDESVLTREVHQMRAFNSDEIVDFIHAVGGSEIQFFNGSDYKKSLHTKDWKFGVLFHI